MLNKLGIEWCEAREGATGGMDWIVTFWHMLLHVLRLLAQKEWECPREKDMIG